MNITKQTNGNTAALMILGSLVGTIALFTSSNVSALEVGDNAPCVVLNQIAVNGSESEHCIRDTKIPGQYKVLEFFSATCSDCAKNYPLFDSLNTLFQNEATFRLIGIDRDEALLRKYVANKNGKLNVEVALDTDRDAKKAYGIVSTPTLFILNAQDQVLFKHEGVLNKTDIANIAGILSK